MRRTTIGHSEARHAMSEALVAGERFCAPRRDAQLQEPQSGRPAQRFVEWVNAESTSRTGRVSRTKWLRTISAVNAPKA
jgi:hypothetical protein